MPSLAYIVGLAAGKSVSTFENDACAGQNGERPVQRDPSCISNADTIETGKPLVDLVCHIDPFYKQGGLPMFVGPGFVNTDIQPLIRPQS